MSRFQKGDFLRSKRSKQEYFVKDVGGTHYTLLPDGDGKPGEWLIPYADDELYLISRGEDECSPSSDNVYNIFVYGTLKLGNPLSGYLHYSEFLGEITTAYANYFLEDLGAFPAMRYVGDELGFMIKGEVYAVDDITLQTLDQVEGGYTREILETHPELGEIMYYRGGDYHEGNVNTDCTTKTQSWEPTDYSFQLGQGK